ncbi:M1 family metallopeptidase [Kineosporia babensis]|uniref:Aminopeptidase N n=1 Tax=Kineosporia babensis TaxID=499548 RepID=A0A9X1NLC1_9ACTN|nr:M1 family metallopeptidase [Kineosporia babensis]MCD5315198.1 M1 family metallopeptidase [Kineosporia babensis]
MRRVSIRTFTTSAVTATALAVGAGVAYAAGTPGDPGAGDVYFPGYGNGGYDVEHYDIRVRYQPKTDELSGTTTIVARSTQDLSSFNLDFALKVSSVRVNDRAAKFKHKNKNHELVVTPAREVFKGDPLNIVVKYADTPSKVKVNGFTNWKRTPDGALAVNEPESAWWWFPSNDHPTDKATYDVSALVPDTVQALSNGTVTVAQGELKGWDRWSWRSTTPQATYLAFLAVGKYELELDETDQGEQILNAFSTSLGQYANPAKANIRRSNEVIESQEQWFGAYPFEARGSVVVPFGWLGFALETQTRPVYDARFWRNGSAMYVVAHEQAHQWFGDSVSVGQWRDIWLNEGFASYAEWLWSEQENEGTPQELFDYAYEVIPAEDPFWDLKIGDPGPAEMFAGPVYLRGAMAVHALRMQIGDKAFRTLLKTWLKNKENSHGTTAEFIALAEKISKQDLTKLFDAWLFTSGKPELGTARPDGRSRAALPTPVKPKSWDKIRQTHADLADH